MRPLTSLLDAGRSLRTIGFDDAPFQRTQPHVDLAGIVTQGTRFEGMLWGQATPDGTDATDVVAGMLTASKFHDQVHAVLLDGLAVGGFNFIDLPALADATGRPCIAVLRKPPDFAAITRALRRLPHTEARLACIERAGVVHGAGPCFQVAGIEAEVAARVLRQATDRGHVPECLRLAHLIGGAVKRGQSGQRA